MKLSYIQRFVPLIAVLGLAACGSSTSSNDSTNSSTTIQLYNASPNSSAITLSVDDSSLLTNITFSDASTTYDIDATTYDISISANDAQGDEQDIITQSLSLDSNQHNLFVVNGDFSQPQLTKYVVNYPELETDEVNIIFTNFSEVGNQYNVYIGEKDKHFEDALFIGPLNKDTLTDGTTFIENDYIIYLTDDNDTLVFESQEIPLYWQNTYIIALRDHFGPGEPALAVDVLTTSTTVNSYNDVNAEAEFRVINAFAQMESVTFKASPSEGEAIDQTLSYLSSTAFYEVNFGDFQLSLLDESDEVLINNMLFTLNQNETKSVVLYGDEQGEITGTIIEQDVRPRAYEHELTLFNATFDYSEVDYYFVTDDTTIETTPYHISAIEFEEIKQFIIPDGEYQIKVVHRDDQDNLTLLFQSEPVEFTQSNYMLILQKDPASEYGYHININQ